MTTLEQLTTELHLLADQLRVDRLESHVIESYHEVMRNKSIVEIARTCKQLRDSYRPRGTRDFPVLGVFAETSNSLADGSREPTYDINNWEATVHHYRTRGFKIWRRGDPEPADY